MVWLEKNPTCFLLLKYSGFLRFCLDPLPPLSEGWLQAQPLSFSPHNLCWSDSVRLAVRRLAERWVLSDHRSITTELLFLLEDVDWLCSA